MFRPDRVKRTLETIKRCNVALSKTGAANYAHADGSPAPVGGYGTYSYFPPEVLMLAMTYMYAGQREFGLDLARRCWENITCTWRYTWDAPNIMRGDKDTGESVYGHDYYQDMMLWSLPAALAGQPMDGVVKPGDWWTGSSRRRERKRLRTCPAPNAHRGYSGAKGTWIQMGVQRLEPTSKRPPGG